MSGGQRLCLFLIVLCLVACRPEPTSTRPLAGFPCLGGGSNDKQGPIVCIDSNTLAARPDEVHIHDHQAGNGNAPVVIQWFTSAGGGDLDITMKAAGCIEDIKCPSPGHCRGKSNVKGKGNRCDYKITLNGRVKDPTVIVDQCCM